MATDEDNFNNGLVVQNTLVTDTTRGPLPAALKKRLADYPENRRRPVNKTVYRNGDFELTYNVRTETFAIKAPDLVYSAIPYDTGRNYIQRAAVQYLLRPEAVTNYLELHRPNLERYLELSLFQVTGQRYTADSPEVQRAYQDILSHPLFKMQVVGRLLQHDETGPLSANLAGKFLYSENQHTGIAAYLSSYLNFVVQLTHALPVTTDGKTVGLLSSKAANESTALFLTGTTDVDSAVTTLPAPLQRELGNVLVPQETPLRRSEVGTRLAQNRKNYVAHSVAPAKLEQYFTNVLPTSNQHLINVLSDVHATGTPLPFSNPNFNIVAGDLADVAISAPELHGLYVIGNHDLRTVLPTDPDRSHAVWDPWRPFFGRAWFQDLIAGADTAWPRLPLGDKPYYDVVATVLRPRLPNVVVLNNLSLIHDGVRYVGLTIPVELGRRHRSVQRYVRKTLTQLLSTDTKIPTVIVSHAPLFNELSMLSPRSRTYKRTYGCDDPGLKQLFADYNVVGVVHGHHHIPASAGQVKWVDFAGRRRFVVCSIYSKMNTGFDLDTVLKS